MGKGGGPTSSTTVTSNIPEYARPYVENMLGAAEQQVFTTNAAGDYSGFRPYTPYSTNPQDYFAGPTGLQQQAYSEAQQMQTPGQFYTGTGLTGLAGLGQLGTTQRALGAGSQYASQVTNPAAVQSYMSPYQQGVTDVAKQAAIREAQLAQNQANLGAARQGTYGGARQALARSERERNLLTNLSNIQTQGSQQAYDRAIANMQYGSNLGLQGLSAAQQGLSGAAATGQGLAGIGAQQQASDLSRIQAQNALGQGQQQYQQGIINQAIQDYATQQQYPMMQLSTLSSLLRGLPLQSTSTQQYQAQAPIAQQAAGLLGAYGAYKGAFKEGGAVVPGYKSGVLVSTENKIDDIAEAGGIKGLQNLLAQTKSQEAKDLINERIRELGIGGANVGKLGTNMAGGGIIAFNGEDNSYVDPAGNIAYSDSNYSLGDMFHNIGTFGRSLIGLPEYQDFEEQEREKKRKALAEKAKNEADKKDEKDDKGAKPPVTSPASPISSTSVPPSTGGMAGLAGYKKAFYDATGLKEGPGEKNRALMEYLEGDQSRLGERYGEAGRMNKALAILEGAQDPRGLLSGVTTSGKAFLKGEAELQKQRRAEEGQIIKMQADVEAARDALARKDFDAYSKHMENAEDRKNRIEVAQIGAAAHGATSRHEEEQIKRTMAENPGMTYVQAMQTVKGAGRFEPTSVQAIKTQLADINTQIMFAGKDEKLKKELMAKRDELNKRLEQISGINKTDVAGGKNSGAVDKSNPLLKG